MEKNKRAAIVDDVFYGIEDHGVLTCYVTLQYIGGGKQGFGGLDLSTKGSGVDFYNSVCRLFGTQDLDSIVGKKCFALFSFGYHNESIEGLENEYGRRFTLTSFGRRYDSNIPTPLAKEKQRHFNEIERSKDRILSSVKNIKLLESQYVDWDKP